MPTPPKKTNKSVTFTPEATDQTLLAAIEQVLIEEQYHSFSDLCKQALQQALLAAPSAPVNDPAGLEVVLASVQQQITQLEANLMTSQSHRLSELEQQLAQVIQQLEVLHIQGDRGCSELQAEIANSTNHQTTEYLNRLTSQLVHLTTQVEAIETNIALQTAKLHSQLSQNPPVLTVLVPPANSAETELEAISTEVPAVPEPVLIPRESLPKAAVTEVSSQASDPILRRLSTLLEDF